MTNSENDLTQKKCPPCEGGVAPLTIEQAQALMPQLDQWEITADGKFIKRTWIVKNFIAAMEFLNAIATIAEDERHHPDIHITKYRNVTIELTTHAINGLSENDFIVAAKIDQLPVKLKG